MEDIFAKLLHHCGAEREPRAKLHGYEFWTEVLKSPKYVMAPMVRESAFRFAFPPLTMRSALSDRHHEPWNIYIILHRQTVLVQPLFAAAPFSYCRFRSNSILFYAAYQNGV
jgi:hypothetical protein